MGICARPLRMQNTTRDVLPDLFDVFCRPRTSNVAGESEDDTTDIVRAVAFLSLHV